jgi:hypothetical protein
MTKLIQNSRQRKLSIVVFIALAFLGEISYVSGFQRSHCQPPLSTLSLRLLNDDAAKSRRAKRLHQVGAVELESDGKVFPSELSPVNDDDDVYTVKVPTEMSDAVKVFFFSANYGPLMVVASIMGFSFSRFHLSPMELPDIVVFGASILFWSVQEHFLHQKLLHSKQDWIGKDIHEDHHKKPYYHISIDPASLLLGWMFTAHVFLMLVLPLPLALSATVGYACSGLFYEWAHYIVHTKVRFPNGFWKRVKDNHVRHHMVNYNYWFAFSCPWIDDLFGTNPPVREVERMRK